MEVKKRTCIFTKKPANAKFSIKNDRHSWVKTAPCNKEYLLNRDSDTPTELEIRLVELFYEQELCRLRLSHYEAKMDEIRENMGTYKPVQLGFGEEEKPEEISRKVRRSISEIAKDMKSVIERKPEIEAGDKFTSISEQIKVYDEPEEPLPPETIEKLTEKPAKPAKEESVCLSSNEKNATIKKVVKKNKGLWD